MEWKVVEYPFCSYEVSNMGEVRNRNTKRVLKPQISKKGYLRVHLYGDKCAKFVSIHRLVAIAFLENPLGLPEINHKNENKKDNRIGNLASATTATSTKM